MVAERADPLEIVDQGKRQVSEGLVGGPLVQTENALQPAVSQVAQAQPFPPVDQDIVVVDRLETQALDVDQPYSSQAGPEHDPAPLSPREAGRRFSADVGLLFHPHITLRSQGLVFSRRSA